LSKLIKQATLAAEMRRQWQPSRNTWMFWQFHRNLLFYYSSRV